ncbi:MAG: hypothetical protein ABEK10_00165 [Candidatus Nanosalina sp.]
MRIFASIRACLKKLLGKDDFERKWQKIAEEGLEIGCEDFPEDRGELYER